MKEIIIKGTINYEWDLYDRIKIVTENGYKIDLINRFNEIAENYPGKDMQVSYYISQESISEIEMQEKFLSQISGGIYAEYEAEHYYYSSWTNGTYYKSHLKIGGHDLHQELIKEDFKYIILKIKIKE